MHNYSPDAERILRLPCRHVPGFEARVQQLASDPKMTLNGAIDILDAEMQAAGVSQLDFEMYQPGNNHRLGFMPSDGTDPREQQKDSIAGHVQRLLLGEK